MLPPRGKRGAGEGFSLEDGSSGSHRVTDAAPVHYKNWRLPASYANFYISNACVIVPTFNDPNDRVAPRHP